MTKMLVLFVGLVCAQISFGQKFQYEFMVEGIERPGEAKQQIEIMRNIIGGNSAKFEDNQNLFILESKSDINVDNLKHKFQVNGIQVIGEIIKKELE